MLIIRIALSTLFFSTMQSSLRHRSPQYGGTLVQTLPPTIPGATSASALSVGRPHSLDEPFSTLGH